MMKEGIIVSLKKRIDGRYKVSCTIDGKRHYFYGQTIKEAEELRDKYNDALQSAPNVDYNITLGKWLAIWIKGAKSTLAANTYQSYKYQLMHYILPHMAKIKLIDLQPYLFRQLITDLLAHGYSNRSVEYALSVVRIALRQAVNDGILPKFPMRGVKLPKKIRTQVQALSQEESQQLLSVITNKKHYNLYWVDLHTGLRRSEILGLRIKDINTKDSTLSVNQTVLTINNKPTISSTTKNAASRRTISIDPQTLAIIRKQTAITYKERLKSSSYEDNGLLFCRADGRQYDPKYISHTANKYGKLIGIHLSFHMLRHTHATLLVKAGVHFKIIQSRLGHSTFQQTMDTYSHIIPDIENDIVSKLTNLV
jgi:integrase